MISLIWFDNIVFKVKDNVLKPTKYCVQLDDDESGGMEDYTQIKSKIPGLRVSFRMKRHKESETTHTIGLRYPY